MDKLTSTQKFELKVAKGGLKSVGADIRRVRDAIGGETPHLLEGDAATIWTGLNMVQAMCRRAGEKLDAVLMLTDREPNDAGQAADWAGRGYTQPAPEEDQPWRGGGEVPGG